MGKTQPARPGILVCTTRGLPRSGAAKRQTGQALVFSLFAAMLMILSMFAMYSMSGQAVDKMKLQNTADAAAYSAAVAEARDYNFSAYTNRAMIANQVAVAQFVGMTSWFRNMAAFAKGDSTNAGRTIYQFFFDALPSPLGNFYMKFLKIMGNMFGIFEQGKAGSTFMSVVVTLLDGLIKVYGVSQQFYHYGTALTIAETLGVFGTLGDLIDNLTGVDWFSNLSALDGPGNIIAKNDQDASLTPTGGLMHVAYHLFKWFSFTESKDPNTQGKDGDEADRFAQIALDSLDDFSRDRSTKPAWGFSFFYAPPMTFIDPTRFIPYQNGPLFMPVIHRGGTELKLTDTSGAGTGSGPGSDPDGSGGLDCHGNPTTANTSTAPAGSGSVSVQFYSELAAFNATACEGDSGIVRETDASGTKGAYAFNGTTWIDPSQMTNTQGSKTGRTSGSGSGNTGTKGNMAKKSWTAMDASSWAGIDIIWITIPIIFIPLPIPIPFAPPWMPLSHGAAQSGTQMSAPTVLGTDNNFGVSSSEAYGGAASSWTTRLAAEMRQNKGAGNTLDKFGLGGLTTYRDVTKLDQDNLVGPPLVVEIEKSIDKTAKSPGVGQFALENGAPKKKLGSGQNMRALSKAEVYFSRPTDEPGVLPWFQRTTGTADQVELGSLYNPYWQARLAPNSFLEQYLSMEMLRSGL